MCDVSFPEDSGNNQKFPSVPLKLLIKQQWEEPVDSVRKSSFVSDIVLVRYNIIVFCFYNEISCILSILTVT